MKRRIRRILTAKETIEHSEKRLNPVCKGVSILCASVGQEGSDANRIRMSKNYNPIKGD